MTKSYATKLRKKLWALSEGVEQDLEKMRHRKGDLKGRGVSELASISQVLFCLHQSIEELNNVITLKTRRK